jgi:hypothetical protein
VADDCDNVLSPRGVALMIEIDNIIQEDEEWKSLCLADSDTNRTCADNLETLKLATISPVPIFK